MALFQFKMLRQFIRRHTRPMKEVDAATWKGRLSLAYMLLAWNAFGFVVYQIWTGKSDWAKDLKNKEEMQLTAAQQWSQTLGIKDAQVYRVSGFKVNSYEIHNKFDSENREQNTETVESQT